MLVTATSCARAGTSGDLAGCADPEGAVARELTALERDQATRLEDGWRIRIVSSGNCSRAARYLLECVRDACGVAGATARNPSLPTRSDAQHTREIVDGYGVNHPYR